MAARLLLAATGDAPQVARAEADILGSGEWLFGVVLDQSLVGAEVAATVILALLRRSFASPQEHERRDGNSQWADHTIFR